MKKKKIQLLEKQVTTPSEVVRISEDLDNGYKKLIGISMLSTMGENHVLRSCLLGSRELLPKDFEADFIQSNTYVAPNERFFALAEIADGKKMDIEFQDGGKRDRSAYPYTLKIYLLLEND